MVLFDGNALENVTFAYVPLEVQTTPVSHKVYFLCSQLCRPFHLSPYLNKGKSLPEGFLDENLAGFLWQ
jgi:hypothetical protein